MEKINVVVEKSTIGYSAYVEGLPVFVGWETMGEVKEEVLYCLNFFHEDKGKLFVMEQLNFKEAQNQF